MEHTPIDVTSLPPAVAKAVQAPGPARMMAARGLAPLGPKDFVTALYQLTLDVDAKIGEAARQTASKLPDNLLSAALGEALDLRVLDFFALQIRERPALIERLLLNAAVADETLVAIAPALAERELEILATNQLRLLRCPTLIERIYFNKKARMSTVDRLIELAIRNGLTLDVPQYKEMAARLLGTAAPPPPDPEHPDPGPEVDDVFSDGNTGGELDDVFDQLLDETWDQGPIGSLEFDAEQEKKKATQIAQLSVNAKIRLATLGTVFHRTILIRDTNRLVSMACIESPAVSEQEAARHASNRALSEDVIRYIANRRDWQKSYQIKVALANNPKCPLAHSLKLLTHLRPTELRSLARSKNIPAALARAAKEAISRKI